MKNLLLTIALLAGAQASAATPTDIDLSILDSKINPCTDFYQYACGGWLAKTEIPSDRPAWSRSFSTIDLNNRKILEGILKGYAAGKTKPANPYAKLLGDFYGACMDEKTVETTGLPELQKQLSEIDHLSDLKGLAPLLAKLHRQGTSGFFNFGEEQDAKDSTQVIGGADQGGLGLPDRDYYLKDDAKMVQIRGQYRDHIAKMFSFLTKETRTDNQDVVIAIETLLAKNSMSRVDRRNPNNVYHRLERAGLIERTPLFDWAAYFNGLDPKSTPELQKINVAVPEFFVGLNKILKDTKLDDIKTYLKWHLMTSITEALPKRFVDERFHFVSSALSGQKKIEDRWKRCVRASDVELGFALGRSFVEVAYGEEGKAKSQSMIQDIESQFNNDVKSLSWMDDKTKEGALKKLLKLDNKVGYPKVWRSYDGIVLDRKSYLKNLQATTVFETEYELAKIGKPVDLNEWSMTPSTVNAYYNPQKNEIVFPAGILQYPFFNRESPDTLNYGAIGVVMGHELTHGFDDQGRRYDAEGNLKEWWDQKVLEKFEARTACVEKEYSEFEALPGLHLNGKLTLGENIADQGGMALAYRAWQFKHHADKPVQVKAGIPAPEQQLFIAFAQSWCQKEQEQTSRMRVNVDPHSPSRYRVNGVLSQFEPFAKAYSCPADSKMAPKTRCEVW